MAADTKNILAEYNSVSAFSRASASFLAPSYEYQHQMHRASRNSATMEPSARRRKAPFAEAQPSFCPLTFHKRLHKPALACSERVWIPGNTSPPLPVAPPDVPASSPLFLSLPTPAPPDECLRAARRLARSSSNQFRNLGQWPINASWATSTCSPPIGALALVTSSRASARR